MKKQIFKKGDTVYHWKYGEGKITDIYSEDAGTSHPITSCFGSDNYQTFMLDGRFINDEQPTLSFTPYDLVKRGFSQARPNPELKEGQMVWVKNGCYWDYGIFSDIREGRYGIKHRNGAGVYYFDEYSVLNPYPGSIEAKALNTIREFVNTYRKGVPLKTGVAVVDMEDFLKEIDNYEK